MLVKFEQIRMVQTTRNFELVDKKTVVVIVFFFDKDFNKNYGSLTLATRVKVALNMAYSTCLLGDSSYA